MWFAHWKHSTIRMLYVRLAEVLRRKTLPKMSLLLEMQLLVVAWDAVTTIIVVNCFQKSKISSESQKAAIPEVNDSFKELEEEIENLHSIQPGLVSENMDAASFAELDAQVLAVQPSLSDAEIVVELLETEDVSNYKDNAIETEDEPVYCPDRNKLL